MRRDEVEASELFALGDGRYRLYVVNTGICLRDIYAYDGHDEMC